MQTVNAIVMLLLCVLVTSCETPVSAAPPSVLEVPGPRLRPPPDSVMVERPANFRSRLVDFFSGSSTMPTTSPDSLLPPKK